MRYKIYILITMLILFVQSSLLSQTPQADLQRMTKVYRDAKSFSMDITARFYSKSADAENTVQTGKACRSEDSFFSQLMGRTTIYNNRCRLLVDEQQRLILFNKPYKKEDASVSPEEQLFMDSAFYATAKLKYISQDAQHKKIEIKTGTNTFERMEVTINAKTFVLEQVIYYYAEKSENGVAGYTRSEITYTNVLVNKPIAETVFSEKKYIARVKNTLAGVGIYAAYKVIDQTQTKTPKK